MSSKACIEVKHLGKCFSLYPHPLARLKQIFLPQKKVPSQDFWALREINFEIFPGDCVGIIGQNGSGKSTLLQIITGLMKPSEGEVIVRGKVAALLELGSGFNPEFSGRENVYLNAALLGLNRQATEEKFDAIAAFADIGPYLEQPVKTYSSGMMLRLAFAVQIFVESDILIIDEALAVGDARFQLKCFKRLEELKAKGTTLLFVSHAYDLVRSFCAQGLVLDKGRMLYWGDAKTATLEYLASIFPEKDEAFSYDFANEVTGACEPLKQPPQDCLCIKPEEELCADTFGIGGAIFDWIKIYGLKKPNFIVEGSPLLIRCQLSWDPAFIKPLIQAEGYAPNIIAGLALADKKGNYIFGCNAYDCELMIDCFQEKSACIEFKLQTPYLMEGDYFLTFAIALGTQPHHLQLKWYDYLIELHYLKTKKNVFGILGISYEMKRLSLDPVKLMEAVKE